MSLLEKLIDKFCHREVCENAPPLSAFYRPSALPTVRTQYTIHGPGFQAENEISRMDGVSPTKKQLCVMEMEVNWTNILFMDQSTPRKSPTDKGVDSGIRCMLSSVMKPKVDLEALKEEIRTLKPRTKLYQVLKFGLKRQKRWKDLPRGDPEKGFEMG